MPVAAVAAVLVVVGSVAAGQRVRRRVTAELTGGAGAGPGSMSRRLRLLGFWVLGLLTLLEGALGLLAPWPVKVVIDNAIGGHPLPPSLSLLSGAGGPVIAMVAAFAGVALVALTALVGYVVTGLGAALYEALGLQWRAGLFRRLLSAPLDFHDRRSSGDLVNRLTGDVAAVQDAALAKAEVLVPDAFSVLGMAVLMLLLSPPLAFAVLVALPALGWIVRATGRRIERAHGEARELAGRLAGQADEALGHLRATHAFGQQDAEVRRYVVLGGQAAAAAVRSSLVGARLSPTSSIAVAVSLAAVLVLATAQVAGHALTLGGLFVFLAYLSAFQQPIHRLSDLAATFGSARASHRRLSEISRLAPLDAGRTRRQVMTGAPVLAVRNVSFGYRGVPVLRDLDVTVEAGELVCVTGPSGAGKSTLLSLLAGLHRPAAGQLLLDGVDVRTLDAESLRRNIALVPQDCWLVAGTIAENIAYGRPAAAPGEVAAVADLALVTEFAERLPQGLQTPVGTQGMLLSGGQRRRVALARALFTGARLLLIDEPTAGLDAESAAAVVRAIRRVAAGRTTLLVSHDPALVAASDRELRLAGGSVERQQLLAGPVY